MNSSHSAFSSGARVAGAILTIGLAAGVAPGPVVFAAGTLGLITLGRAQLLKERSEMLAVSGVLVLTGALAVGALRWGSLDLSRIRGAQGVLGPTVLVGPGVLVGACWFAAVAGVVASAVWLCDRRGDSRMLGALWAVEALAAALALVGVFFGPAIVLSRTAEIWPRLGAWAGATTVVAAVSITLSLLVTRLAGPWRWSIAASAGAAVAAAAILVTVGG